MADMVVPEFVAVLPEIDDVADVVADDTADAYSEITTGGCAAVIVSEPF
jgi:hypothetical protein